ncbi:MAG: DUF554 domain-containing protein [Thermovirgaceae bacterium]
MTKDIIQSIPVFGTLVNAFAIIAGSLFGIVIHRKMPRRLTKITFQALGLFSLFLGTQMAFRSGNILILIFSIVLGAVVGELLNIDGGIRKVSGHIKAHLKTSGDRFTEGFVTAVLLYCVGSIAVLGALEEGLGGFPNLLLTKSLMDGASSIALAASFGPGVLFSAVPLFIYQGSLTLLASQLGTVLTETVINEITAAGGLMILGIGLNILEIQQVKVINMLPGLLFAAVLGMTFL